MKVSRARVALLHYTPPGVIGGVEHVLYEHARLLRERGHDVEFIAGRRAPARETVHVIPEIDAARRPAIEIERQLAGGDVTPLFHETVERIRERLTPLFDAFDAVIVHNAFTLHFSLPLTAALAALAEERCRPALIAWCHDLSWTNPLYVPSLHDGYPWELLRRPVSGVRYVAISEERRRELEALWGGGEVRVIPNGIDVIESLRLSKIGREIVDRYRLLDRDAVLVLPVRITRRKNVEAGIRAVANLKERGLDVRFLVTGPTAPHHPGRSVAYLDDLKSLRHALAVEEEVVFLADEMRRRLPGTAVADLYRVADVLLFPSAQEGFGLPILEAGLNRVPIITSDLPIFVELGRGDTARFQVDESADTIAEHIVTALDTGPARLFRRVVREYRWNAIADQLIVPLLAESVSEERRSGGRRSS